MQNAFNSSVPGEAKLAHLEHRPPSEGPKTRVSVPGECQKRFDCSQRERNSRFVPAARKKWCFFLFLCSQRERNGLFCHVAHKKQLFLRADSKRVAQLMYLGVKYNGDRVRHRLGKWIIFSLHRVLRVIHNFSFPQGFGVIQEYYHPCGEQ